MRSSARLQLLTCLVLYASSAHAIMVKFGTKGGPIEPPAPEPTIPPQPYRDPAPVWEERSNDTPDPNAQWRPPFFVPQPRYTNVVYNPPSPIQPLQQPLNNAQRFANSYIPVNIVKSVQRTQQNQHNPPTILSSQNLPGIGLRYFFPGNTKDQAQTRQEDAKLNQIETNDLGVVGVDNASDFQWKYEKEATRRTIRNSQEGTARSALVYQWPVYVPPRHH